MQADELDSERIELMQPPGSQNTKRSKRGGKRPGAGRKLGVSPKLLGGETYFYVVTAWDGTKESGFSNQVIAVVP